MQCASALFVCWNLLSADLRETSPNGFFQILIPEADNNGNQIDLASLGRLGRERNRAAGAGEGGQIALALHGPLDVADEAAERVNIPAQRLNAGRNLGNNRILRTGHAEVRRRRRCAVNAREAEGRRRAFLAGAARLVMVMMLMLMAGAVLIVAVPVVVMVLMVMLVLVAGAVLIVAVSVVMMVLMMMLMLVAGAVLIVAVPVVVMVLMVMLMLVAGAVFIMAVLVVMMLVLVAAAVLVVAMLMLVHLFSLL